MFSFRVDANIYVYLSVNSPRLWSGLVGLELGFCLKNCDSNMNIVYV